MVAVSQSLHNSLPAARMKNVEWVVAFFVTVIASDVRNRAVYQQVLSIPTTTKQCTHPDGSYAGINENRLQLPTLVRLVSKTTGQRLVEEVVLWSLQLQQPMPLLVLQDTGGGHGGGDADLALVLNQNK